MERKEKKKGQEDENLGQHGFIVERGGQNERQTPSQATIKNSSPSSNLVSVVYGLPTTNSFTEASPRARVTARTPDEEARLRQGGNDSERQRPLSRNEDIEHTL